MIILFALIKIKIIVKINIIKVKLQIIMTKNNNIYKQK